MSSFQPFKYIFLPSDTTKPIQESTYKPYSTDDSISCIVNIAKEYYKSNYSITNLSEKEKAMNRTNIVTSILKEHPNLDVTDNMIDQILNMNLVDTIPLQTNKPPNYIGVNMYVDDQGEAKKLPINERASAICQALNKPLLVKGDCYISRFIDNEKEDIFNRLDFTLKDLESKDTPFFTMNNAKCGDGNITCNNSPHLKCTRCKKISYCSAECQKKDWKRHKNTCSA